MKRKKLASVLLSTGILLTMTAISFNAWAAGPAEEPVTASTTVLRNTGGTHWHQPAGTTYQLQYTDNSDGTVDITGLSENASGTLIIPETIDGKPVTGIWAHALDNGSGLTKAIIPASVTRFGYDVFDPCFNIKQFCYGGTEEALWDAGFRFSPAYPHSITCNCRGPLRIYNDFEQDIRFEYMENPDGTLVLTSITRDGHSTSPNPDPKYILPAEINGKKVTRLGTSAFRGLAYIPSFASGTVIIPDTVTTLDDNVFANTYLNTVIIPDSVTSIGSRLFSLCKDLKFVQFGRGLTSIGEETFCGTYLDQLVLPDTITQLPPEGFGSDSRITRLYYGGNREALEAMKLKGVITSFPDCRAPARFFQPEGAQYKIMCMERPDGTLSIVNILGAPQGRPSGELILPKSLDGKPVTRIEKQAFRGDYTDSYPELTGTPVIPDTVTYIGDRSFGHTGITSVTIPESVTYIGDAAFQETGITSVTIPEGVTYIGNEAFDGCPLETVWIPDSADHIGTNAFQSSTAGYHYLRIYYSGTREKWETFDSPTNQWINPIAFRVTGPLRYYQPEGASYKLVFLELPDGSLTLCDIFGPPLGDLILPESVDGKPITRIEDNAFNHRTLFIYPFRELTGNPVIPDTVTYIGDGAFCDTGITSVIIPEGVTYIGDHAFGGCPLTMVLLPDSADYIGTNAFPASSHTNSYFKFYYGGTREKWETLDSLTSLEITPIAFRVAGPFHYYQPEGASYQLIYLELPDGSLTLCDISTSPRGNLVLPESVDGKPITRIEDNACNHRTPLTSPFRELTGNPVIPDTVTYIGDGAFRATGITSVIIPEGVTAIGDSVFSGCQDLTDIYYGGSEAEWMTLSANAAVPETTIIHCNSTGNQPSDWAAEEVNRAITSGLVPMTLQGQYRAPITRAEFCALTAAFFEKHTGAEITGRNTFTDTTDVNVEKMAFLGVVNGKGDDRFDPDGGLTRQEAAVMLARLANAMGKPLASAPHGFADGASIADWAADAVGQVKAAGIMGGVGGNCFDSLGSYTREQSILTVQRLYQLF